MRGLLRCSRDESGIILPMTLMILVVLATLVGTMLALGTTEPQIAANLVRGAQALSLAEAGADRAIALFAYDSNYLKCVESAYNYDDYASYPNDPNIPTQCGTTGTGTLFSTDATLGAEGTGSYSVTWGPTPSNSYATLVITAVGCQGSSTCATTTPYCSNCTTRVVRVVVTKAWSSKYGVLGKDITITGNAEVRGNAGAVHGNGSTTLGGSEYVIDTATSSSGTCTNCTTVGRVGDPGDSGGNKPSVTLPNKTAADYKKLAMYFLGGGSPDTTIPSGKCTGNITVVTTTVLDGTTKAGYVPNTSTTIPSHWILDASTTSCVLYQDSSKPATSTLTGYNTLAAGTTTNIFSAWSQDNQDKWSPAASQPVAGAYYATKEIDVGGVGTSGAHWSATFIVGGVVASVGTTTADSGVVEFTSNPYIDAYTQTTDSTKPWYNNSLFVVAGNVNLVGTGSFSGTIIATGSLASRPPGYNGNIDIGGNIKLTGNVVAYNKAYVTGSGGGPPNVDGTNVGKIVYNVSGRNHLISPILAIVSWHAISTLD